MAEESAERIELLMSLTAQEYRAGLSVLFGPDAGREPVPVRRALAQGSVEIAFAAQPPVRLGGLLELPQARVTVAFEGAGASERAAFMRRFEIAFQRGGG